MTSFQHQKVCFASSIFQENVETGTGWKNFTFFNIFSLFCSLGLHLPHSQVEKPMSQLVAKSILRGNRIKRFGGKVMLSFWHFQVYFSKTIAEFRTTYDWRVQLIKYRSSVKISPHKVPLGFEFTPIWAHTSTKLLCTFWYLLSELCRAFPAGNHFSPEKGRENISRLFGRFTFYRHKPVRNSRK